MAENKLGKPVLRSEMEETKGGCDNISRWDGMALYEKLFRPLSYRLKEVCRITLHIFLGKSVDQDKK